MHARPLAALLSTLVLASIACGHGAPPATTPAPRVAVPAVRFDSTLLASGDSAAIDALEYLRSLPLMVPVEGMPVERVRDTFGARRGSAIHGAIDIPAPRGTAVVAATAGSIVKIRKNHLGGNTIYATDSAHRLIFYYAHLDHYRRGLKEGMPLAQGEVIGYVGTTGNAPPNLPHLHFQVTTMPPHGHWWGGTPLDPWPNFARGGESHVAGRDQ
ncbi:MAG TPA: M23 family metallopeptidase [Gemmatimonadaceae bacterium]|nr:M23 family metallopeptidase [Gemmatimonadaceae bacterium]